MTFRALACRSASGEMKKTSDTPEPAMKPASTPRRASTYRPWAELLKRTFGVDVLECPTCRGRMRLVAMLTEL